MYGVDGRWTVTEKNQDCRVWADCQKVGLTVQNPVLEKTFKEEEPRQKPKSC